MKKFYSAIAVLLAVASVSCQREASFDEKKIGENTLVFSMQGNASTRAADAISAQKGALIELTDSKTSERFILEETIVDLNAISPVTKGTPAYTENVGKLYQNLGVVVKNGNSELLNTTSFWSMDSEQNTGGGWRYQGEFGGWPTNASTELDFYMWMPVSNNGITGTPTYGKTDGNHTIQFTYSTPTTSDGKMTAAGTQDLILAARGISRNDAKTNRINGVPVLFNHALTGVKFAIANYSSEKKVTIKSISFNGLYDGGKCVITPATESNYADTPTTYSSGDGRVVWAPADLTKSNKAIESGTFSAPIAYQKGGSFSDKGNYPDSFVEGGNTNNLNDAAASQTFWLIPQTMSDAVTLTIVYTCGTDEEKTGVFEFGKALKTGTGDNASYVEWKAGELRTYTIKVDDVNVTITDQFNTGSKSNVVITNTGVTEVYIRAAIMGQWVDPSGNPVFGYTDFKTGDDAGQPASIPSWYQDYMSHLDNSQGYFGKFEGLPGDNWVIGSDGYYYYTLPVAPAGHPTPLFTSYTIDENHRPPMRVGGKWVTTNLLIDVATQAIAAKKQGSGSDLTYISYDQAWQNAEIVASQAETITVQ